MNIKDVYLCDIYMKNECHPIFIKKAIVYWKKNGVFVDLETKEKYKTGQSLAEFGEFFVNLKGKMLSMCNTIDVKKRKLPKRKILRKYDEIKRMISNECK